MQSDDQPNDGLTINKEGKYGLHYFKKENKQTSIFGELESDEENEDPKKLLSEKSYTSTTPNKLILDMQKQALEEDPTVFDFDGVYDDIQQKREEETELRITRKRKEQQKSKYIARMKQLAEERKREYERIRNKKIQKEIEEEKKTLGETEVFITGAYAKKLAEEKKWELERKKQEEKEAKEDVTKRGHLGHFYANLTRNIALGGGEKKKEEKEEQPEVEEKRKPREEEHSPSRDDYKSERRHERRYEKEHHRYSERRDDRRDDRRNRRRYDERDRRYERRDDRYERRDDKYEKRDDKYERRDRSEERRDRERRERRNYERKQTPPKEIKQEEPKKRDREEEPQKSDEAPTKAQKVDRETLIAEARRRALERAKARQK